jgi:hypothetical protein
LEPLSESRYLEIAEKGGTDKCCVRSRFSCRVIFLLFTVTLSVRLLACIPVSTPRSLDECYYMMVSRNLVQGRGFTSDIVWNHLRGVEGLAIPSASNRFWMPLSSLAMYLTFSILGPSYRVAQITMAVLSAFLPMVGFWLSLLAFRDHRRPLLVWFGLLFSPWFFLYWGTPDNFGLFGTVASLSLILFTLVDFRLSAAGFRTVSFAALAGFFAGLAHLSRADGILVPAVGVLFLALRGRGRPALAGWAIVVTLLGYLLVMGPWMARNISEFGTPLVSDGRKTIFMTQYNQIMFFTNPPTESEFFSKGLKSIIVDKMAIANLGLTFWVAGMSGFVMLPGLFVWLLCFRSGRPENLHAFYAVVFTAVLLLVFTFPSQRGTLWHTAAAALPFVLVAGVRGWWIAGVLMARRFFHRGISSSSIFGFRVAVTVVIIYSLMTVPFSMRYLSLWNEEYDPYSRAFDYVAAQRATSQDGRRGLEKVTDAPVNEEILITGRPGLANFCKGFRAVVTPLDGNEAVKALLTHVKADYIVDRASVFSEEPRGSTAWKRVASFGSIDVMKVTMEK